MTNNRKLSISAFAMFLLCAVILFVAFFGFQHPAAAGEGGPAARSCTSASSTVVAVGNQLATTIMSASGQRAYVRIEQPANATNTVAIQLSSSAATILGSSVTLTPATSTSPVPIVAFGINTDNPYSGPVSVITSAGSTTISVFECRYN